MYLMLFVLGVDLCSCEQFTSLRSSLPTSYMVGIDVQIPSAFDPFAEAKDSGAPGAKEYVHIRIQQRNGKKSLTTVQGLTKEFSYEKILKDLKKELCCNGNVVQDKELGKVIQPSRRSEKECFTFPCDYWCCKKGSDQDSWFLSCGVVEA
ncbi:hypothetical protein RND71_007980 [Anisodus tanguticus]|uniref:SUI1 domain-containing protein n=1 Tax=Anisodus tanguticus TaxID=243964 RepID=A0AAE1VQ85_9SOLA|nr:hypothetical protein RND71_007980 [Anisodus tanguticus]